MDIEEEKFITQLKEARKDILFEEQEIADKKIKMIFVRMGALGIKLLGKVDALKNYYNWRVKFVPSDFFAALSKGKRR